MKKFLFLILLIICSNLASASLLFNLSDRDNGDWMGANSINDIAYSSDYTTIFLGLSNGKFGYYDITTNNITDYSSHDVSDWLSTYDVNEVEYCPSRVFIGGEDGRFGFDASGVLYNKTNTIKDYVNSQTITAMDYLYHPTVLCAMMFGTINPTRLVLYSQSPPTTTNYTTDFTSKKEVGVGGQINVIESLWYPQVLIADNVGDVIIFTSYLTGVGFNITNLVSMYRIADAVYVEDKNITYLIGNSINNNLEFGYYNHSSNTYKNLNSTISGGYPYAVEYADNKVLIGGVSMLWKYDTLTNTSTNVSNFLINDLLTSGFTVRSLKYSSNDDRIYIGTTDGKLGYYDLNWGYSLSAPSGLYGGTSTISINLSKDSNQNYISAILVYDGTSYNSPTQTDYSSYTIFSQTITNDIWNASTNTYDYYWNISFTNYEQSFDLHTETGNHTVETGLNIYFQLANGTSVNTSGQIITETPFTTTSFVNVSSINTNINSTGVIRILYNAITSGETITNWTQYYEYENEPTVINENLTIIPTDNLWYGYILVKDLGNTPIPNAIVEARYVIAHWYAPIGLADPETGTLLGRRLTWDNGYTFFIADKNSQILFSVSKEGYETEEKLITIGDDDYTQANPILINLRQGNTNMIKNLWGYVPNEFRNLSKNIEGTIVAYDYDKVEITTDYRTRVGSGLRDITCTTNCFRGRNTFTLTSCIDFNCTANNKDDIILNIYADDEFITNWTITNNYGNITNIMPTEELPDVRTKLAAILQAIALLFAIILMNLIFIGHAGVGTNTFFVGIIILSIINPTYYMWLGFIGAAYYGFKLIKMLIDE